MDTRKIGVGKTRYAIKRALKQKKQVIMAVRGYDRALELASEYPQIKVYFGRPQFSEENIGRVQSAYYNGDSLLENIPTICPRAVEIGKYGQYYGNSGRLCIKCPKTRKCSYKEQGEKIGEKNFIITVPQNLNNKKFKKIPYLILDDVKLTDFLIKSIVMTPTVFRLSTRMIRDTFPGLWNECRLLLRGYKFLRPDELLLCNSIHRYIAIGGLDQGIQILTEGDKKLIPYNLIPAFEAITENYGHFFSFKRNKFDKTGRYAFYTRNDDFWDNRTFVHFASALPSSIEIRYLKRWFKVQRIITGEWGYNKDLITVIQCPDHGYYKTSLNYPRTREILIDKIMFSIRYALALGLDKPFIGCAYCVAKEMENELKTVLVRGKFEPMDETRPIHFWGSRATGSNLMTFNRIIKVAGSASPNVDAYLPECMLLSPPRKLSSWQRFVKEPKEIPHELWKDWQTEATRNEILQVIGRSRMWTETKEKKMVVILGQLDFSPYLEPKMMTWQMYQAMAMPQLVKAARKEVRLSVDEFFTSKKTTVRVSEILKAASLKWFGDTKYSTHLYDFIKSYIVTKSNLDVKRLGGRGGSFSIVKSLDIKLEQNLISGYRGN